MAETAEEIAFLAYLEWRLQTSAAFLRDDLDCARYLVENQRRLLPRLMLKKQKHGGEMDDIVAEFVTGVHKRHLSGLPLN